MHIAEKDRRLGAFSNVDTADSADFIERLDKMNAFHGFRRYKRESFELMRIGAGSRVADIGCGTGDDARQLAEIVGAAGHVFGVDLSKAMIAEASNRFADCAQLEFAAASVEALPIATASLDAIRLDRVLIHVPEPRAAIEEMLRVLRPGGRIVLCEPDMIGFWVSSDEPEIAELVVGSIGRTCIHPYLPRDLGVMLGDMGLGEVELAALAMVSHDFETTNRSLHFDLAAQAAIAANPALADRIEAWMAEQRRRRDYERFCAGMTIMTASATKP